MSLPDFFPTRLAETIAWCTPRASRDQAQYSLRSAELMPRLVHDRELPPETLRDAGSDEAWFQFIMGAGERSWGDVVDEIALKRGELLRQAATNFRPEEVDLRQGLLLLFEDDLAELDGSLQRSSAGYFNACDVAPWDTWVCFLPKSETRRSALLVSWVPPVFMETIQSLVAANPNGSLRWTPSGPEFQE